MLLAKGSHFHKSRHRGENRNPLDKCKLGGAARVEKLLWVPAFAGMTDGEGFACDNSEF